MNKTIYWAIIIAYGVVCFQVGNLVVSPSHLEKRNWLCTKDEVTKDALPKEFKCTQYTLKEILND